MRELIIPFEKSKHLIEEGDILLFRGASLMSKAIQKIGNGVHSHAAIASWSGDILECVEFREFKGGRTVRLESQIIPKVQIDIFRPVPSYNYWKRVEINGQTTWTNESRVWGDVRKKQATDMMRRMTGLPYGWKRISLMAMRRFMFIRFIIPYSTDDFLESEIYPVCSTAVCTTLRKVYVDPVPFKPDCYVEPPDLARSAVLNYLFSIRG